MPELLSVHGRCPRCSQVLTVPAGQLESVFRCARCQYRAAAAALVAEARSSPPRLASHHAPALDAFDEDSDDQHTRVLLPDGPDEESESPLEAILVPDGSTTSRPPPLAPALQRFNALADEGDEQQTRLHLPGSFDAPPPARASSLPGAAARPLRSAPFTGRSSRDATLLGVPLPALAGLPLPAAAPRPPAAPSPAAELQRFDRASVDSDDQATRLHLPDEFGGGPRALRPMLRDQTLIGVAPASSPPPDAPQLQRFDRVEEDAEDQHTRLVVPISYEEEAAAASPAADLRAPVASRVAGVRSPLPEPEYPLGAVERWGRSTLQLSRSLDDWLHERRTTLLITLSVLTALLAPALDGLLGGPRHGPSVIVSNLVLFFLWTLGFAWLGKLRNDLGAWDPSVAWTRWWTAFRLAAEDALHFGGLPSPLRYRVLGEFSGAIGLLGLCVASVLTISQLVWNWPGASGGLLTGRVWGGALVAISVIAARRAASVPAGFVAPQEIAAPAVAHFPAVLDLSVPVNLHAPSGMTPLHQVLEVLAEWVPREWPNQDSYIAALERHFLRHMSWAPVERDRWLGTHRVDGVAHFIVNESLLVEVIRGFDADTAERLNVRMRSHAKIWRGKPALIVAFDASRSAMFSGAGTPKLEALHQAYPILTVRMPSARLGLA
jgi:hypothetical protein